LSGRAKPRTFQLVTNPAAPPPVAFRLKRPYVNEDEFVEGDGHAISRSGMVLIGAGPRPPGLIVRFELALRDGSALFRGEGKVVAHRVAAEANRPAGLELKFTRLDTHGKQIVERVLRERHVAQGGSPSVPPASMPSGSMPSMPPPGGCRRRSRSTRSRRSMW
jgi:hypothetical protein